MWFSEETNKVYSEAIEPAIRESGYKPMRIDTKQHNNKIDDEIILEIQRSKFLIADFTSGFISSENEDVLIARGGVYYEAGFAQGLKLPVIWSCREDCIDHLHFDTRQYSHIVWKDSHGLKVQLINRIGATIGLGPLLL